MSRFFVLAVTALTLSVLATTAIAQDPPLLGDGLSHVFETDEGLIIAVDADDAQVFTSWREYVNSSFFSDHAKHCGARDLSGGTQAGLDGSTSDCSNSLTNPAAEYSPNGGELYRIPVVVHILMHPNGSGSISDAMVNGQIDILNEDFSAMPGSNGAGGTDTTIEFYLATQDPNGNPTTGITRNTSAQWYNDSGNYAGAIGWDTNRYLNIYTNTASGNLGYAYVPSGGGVVGSSFDGVRILWTSFGPNAPIGHPYNLGRTTTHEVGHYLGLYHTFQGGCSSTSGCYANGDLICDTNPESQPMGSGACSRSTCSSSDPVSNYMDYSDDICMYEFTSDQSYRMRCTMQNWRVDLGAAGGNAAPSVSITSPANGTHVDDGTSLSFSGTASDAEDGNLSGSIAWSSDRDGALGTGGSVNAVLSVGSHTITAQVEDSGGLTGNDQITVVVDPLGGGTITASGTAYARRGKVFVDLTWSGAVGSNVEIWRDGQLVKTTANDGAYTDNTKKKSNLTWSFTYQICEVGGGTCSDPFIVNY